MLENFKVQIGMPTFLYFKNTLHTARLKRQYVQKINLIIRHAAFWQKRDNENISKIFEKIF